MFSAIVRARVIDALEGTPDLLWYVLDPLPEGDPRWDAHPDPERYSLRELLAHLADWDPIWLDRMQMTVGGTEPNLKPYDIAERAVERAYALAGPRECLARLAASRPKMVTFLRGLAGNEWKRIAFHPEEGRQSIETQAAWVLAHDDYYVKQAVQWLKRAG